MSGGYGGGETLPFPRPSSASQPGPYLADSVHCWRKEPKRLPEDAPNVVIFMTDDAGFSLPECNGGPVHMPTLDRVNRAGVKYNRFHTTAMCSPTRASLLTGRNHHAVGFGQICEFANDFDGYIGEIPRSAATVGHVLGQYGYDTAAFGKWHNTPITDLTKSGPFEQYPTGQGFNSFYGFIAGETSQYEPRLYRNTVPIEPPRRDDYHLTEDLADQAIKFIRHNRALKKDKPVFLYITPGATHGPHHIFKEWADKYKGRFDGGWEKLREETFKKQKEMGWIPADTTLNPIHETMQKWEDVPDAHKPFQTRLMEVYAGFLEHTDVQYGKVLDELEAQGMLENTLVFYIHSDNGASAEGMFGTISELLAQNGMVSTIEEQLQVLHRDYGGLDALGTALLDNMYHHGWAWACDTPFKSTKLVAAHFGGTRTPLGVMWPRKIKHDPRPRVHFHHVIDIAPTIYEAIGIVPPRVYNGWEQQPIDGVSFLSSLFDASAKETKMTQYFEIMGSRGIYHDGWFACTFGPRTPWVASLEKVLKWKPEEDVWELYDLRNDYSQGKDLAEADPQKLKSLKEMFMVHAARNQVLPVGGALFALLNPTELKASSQTSWCFDGDMDRVVESMAPKFVSGFSTLATVDADLPAEANGVLYCVGGISAGFTVFMKNGYLQAEYNAMTLNRYKVRSEAPLQHGRTAIEVEVKFDQKARESGGSITMRQDGKQVGQGRFERSVPTIFTASETFDVGKDLGSPVSLDYHEQAPFAFTGKIHKVLIKYI